MYETETRNLSKLERLLPTTGLPKRSKKYTSLLTHVISPYHTKEVGLTINPQRNSPSNRWCLEPSVFSLWLPCLLYRTLSEGFQSLFQLGQLQNRHNGKDFPVTHLRNILINYKARIWLGVIRWSNRLI